MKYFIFLSLAVGLTFAQTANGNGSASNKELNVTLLNIIKPELAITWMRSDFNNDGYYEILKGEKIIKLSDNAYWVKNTTMTTESGDVYTFVNKIMKNENSFVKQVNADFGYILLFIEDNDKVVVYIAGESGSYESDPFYISLR